MLDHSLYPDRHYQMQWLTTYLKHSKALKAGVVLTVSKETKLGGERAFETVREHEFDHSCILQDADSVTVSDEELAILYSDVQRQAILSDLMWGLWAIRQAEVSTIDFDFIAYAISKLEGFSIKKKRFLDS